VILFPLAMALASLFGLAVTDAVGMPRGHMTGLQPHAFGFCAFVLATALWLVHAWLSWRASS
jgi:hypothetical protein